jgi:hypothetical protein
MKKNVSFVGMLGMVLALGLVLMGCGRSTESLAKEVQASIEETWEEQGLDIKIENFSLVKKSANEYRGLLEASADGETEKLTINVTIDNDTFMWEIDG